MTTTSFSIAATVGRDAARRRTGAIHGRPRSPVQRFLAGLDIVEGALRAALIMPYRAAILAFGREARCARRLEKERADILFRSIALQGELGGLTIEPQDEAMYIVDQRHDGERLQKAMAVHLAQRSIERNRDFATSRKVTR